MTDTLALEKLYTDVKTRLDTETPGIAIDFGWKKRARWQTANQRLVWQPGDATDALGAFLGAKYPGRNPRPLATIGELFTVFIGAADPSDLQNELANYKATRLLFDAWWRAVYLAAHGTVAIVSAKWATNRTELRHGEELIVVASVEAMVPDEPYTLAPDDTSAAITPSIGSTITGPGTDDNEMIVEP